MHIPVLRRELLELLNIKSGGIYVDCTGGAGGHAEEVLSKLTAGRLIIIERDPDAVERLKERFKGNPNAEVVRGNFKDIGSILKGLGIDKADGLYADFGVSSEQLSAPQRGFSFKLDGRIDMRMDYESGESAVDVVNRYSESQLAEIIYKYGEERFFKRIAYHIVSRRNLHPFENTLDLASVIKQAVPKKFHKQNQHPATKTFQALRIHVNGELEAAESLLREIGKCVEKGGRVAFISFHSLEDRLVKEYLHRYKSPCSCPPEFPICVCGKVPVFKTLTKKPITPSDREIKENPLSRSAKLRAAERI
ncbi:MAG: 16S rRNA (cytosine(1402)-N(4))-methyltransferase RsmH [Deferribacteraceae bacterium]|jgi:16S rRNA (cytosine1402-N4)-methyltransferase|nr:16S rRNA (cytosine(1402)-N(4))-methyltransferase RsmH [Deferribacteraceae bacterium]